MIVIECAGVVVCFSCFCLFILIECAGVVVCFSCFS